MRFLALEFVTVVVLELLDDGHEMTDGGRALVAVASLVVHFLPHHEPLLYGALAPRNSVLEALVLLLLLCLCVV